MRANILKLLRPLTRGDPGAGATTLDEYRQVIEKDLPLSGVQPVIVRGAPPGKRRWLLRGLGGRYETHHHRPSPMEP